MWPTQFGFRPGRSTADAIHVERRIQDHLESSGDPGMMCLLDWEKAFDKLKPEALIVALRRYGLHPKLSSLAQMLYRSTRFFVRLGGRDSEDRRQNMGIRHGCPLSPKLFLVAMSALTTDIKANIGARIRRDRIGGIPPDELRYADDTILFSPMTRSFQECLWEIERQAPAYGLRLIYDKCEVLVMNARRRPKVLDGRRIPQVRSARYLG